MSASGNATRSKSARRGTARGTELHGREQEAAALEAERKHVEDNLPEIVADLKARIAELEGR